MRNRKVACYRLPVKEQGSLSAAETWEQWRSRTRSLSDAMHKRKPDDMSRRARRARKRDVGVRMREADCSLRLPPPASSTLPSHPQSCVAPLFSRHQPQHRRQRLIRRRKRASGADGGGSVRAGEALDQEGNPCLAFHFTRKYSLKFQARQGTRPDLITQAHTEQSHVLPPRLLHALTADCVCVYACKCVCVRKPSDECV